MGFLGTSKVGFSFDSAQSNIAVRDLSRYRRLSSLASLCSGPGV